MRASRKNVNKKLNPLLRKNIESLLVDGLIIFSALFIKGIDFSSIVFVVLVLSTSIILLTGKRPPKNFFLVFFYVISIFFLLFGFVFIGQTFSIATDKDVSEFSILSWVLIVVSVVVLILFLASFSKKNKTEEIIQTFIIPIFFTLTMLSFTSVYRRYSGGAGIILMIYLPLRFLMAFKEPIKWYQFILLFVAMYMSFNVFYEDVEDYPTKPLKTCFKIYDANLSYRIKEAYKNDTIIICSVKKDFEFGRTRRISGDFYIVVSRIWNNTWRIDRAKTIEYYKEKNIYHSDSDRLDFLFFKYNPLGNYKFSNDFYEESKQKDGLRKAKEYCDTAKINIKYNGFKRALQKLDSAEKYFYEYGETYYLKALIYEKNNKNNDSLHLFVDKAIEYNNIDALSIFRRINKK